MDIKDLRKKTSVELEKELSDKATALSNFRFGTSNSKTKNVKAGRNLKREIAQILTILKESKKA
jgi:ribosomal protein L29